MTASDDASELAGAGATAEHARQLLAEVRELAGGDQFYVFMSERSGGAAPSTARVRTLLAFATPDAALAFSQRNHLGGGARLRALRMTQLLLVLVREPAIQAIIFVRDVDESAGGHLPDGVRLERETVIRRLGRS